jgi:hypothetical protein
MDRAEFDGWLSEIAALTPPQRRHAWQTLALSEASDGDDIGTGPPWGMHVASSGPGATPDQPPIFTVWWLARGLVSMPATASTGGAGQMRTEFGLQMAIWCAFCCSIERSRRKDVMTYGRGVAGWR